MKLKNLKLTKTTQHNFAKTFIDLFAKREKKSEEEKNLHI